jgi:hypothetical protein
LIRGSALLLKEIMTKSMIHRVCVKFFMIVRIMDVRDIDMCKGISYQ